MLTVNVDKITKGTVSDDGNEVRIRLGQPGDYETELAFPATMMQPLVLLASHLQVQAAQKRGEPADKIDYVSAQSWGMSWFPDGRVILILNMPGGANISFALPPKALEQMIQMVDGLKAQLEKQAESSSVN